MNPSPSGIKDAQRRSDVTTILLFLEEKRFHREFCFLGTVTLTLIGLPVGWPPEFPNESGEFAGDRDDALVMTELLFLSILKRWLWQSRACLAQDHARCWRWACSGGVRHRDQPSKIAMTIPGEMFIESVIRKTCLPCVHYRGAGRPPPWLRADLQISFFGRRTSNQRPKIPPSKQSQQEM